MEEEAAVVGVGVVVLPDSGSDSAWDSGTLGKGIGRGALEGLFEALLGIAF